MMMHLLLRVRLWWSWVFGLLLDWLGSLWLRWLHLCTGLLLLPFRRGQHLRLLLQRLLLLLEVSLLCLRIQRSLLSLVPLVVLLVLDLLHLGVG